MSVTAVQISERRQKVKTTVSDESIKMRKFISMTMTMLKIGFIGFGGGSALIPVIEDEVVEKDKIVSEEEFNDDVMIASITPGALPVEVATGIGRQASGLKGMAAAATAMALPGALLTVLLQAVISSAGSVVKSQINYLSIGISAFIILTLLAYSLGTVCQAVNKREGQLYGLIILGVFLLSGEKSIYQLFGLDIKPIFALSTIQVLGAAFYKRTCTLFKKIHTSSNNYGMLSALCRQCTYYTSFRETIYSRSYGGIINSWPGTVYRRKSA